VIDAGGNILSNTTLQPQVAANTTAIGTLNTNVTALQTLTATHTGQINTLNTNVASLQALTATHTGQINSLFNLVNDNNNKATEGVAMALAMESPMLPAGTSFGVSGGVGYYDEKAAGTVAVSARIGENAAFSAGVGLGFDTGEVGARGGFQVAW
jgi:hypothetical protein